MTRSSAARRPPADPTTAYARDVDAGKILAGRLVRLACARHLRDLKDGPKRGLIFDVAAAQRVFDFFGFLRLPADGELDGKPFLLEPFQKFKLGSIFGWKSPDGARRFRTAYIEEGKGNGKTPTAAGVGLYGLTADSEVAAEIYSAATTAFQAGILFRDAKRMAEASPALRSRLVIGEHNLAFPATDSFMRAVSSEHRQLSGPRPHFALIDEIHEAPNALVVDKMRAGTKNRRQALIFEITNSGHDRTTVCWQHHEYSVKVLEGVLENDAWFAYVCGLDCCERCRAEGQTQPKEGCPDCDDWRDERVWIKANPGLHTIVPIKYLREQVAEALGIPAKEGICKRLNFCCWTEGQTRAIPMDAWDAGKRDMKPEDLAGRECFAGLDIGSTSDFTALALLFPHEDGKTIEVPVDSKQPQGEKRRILRRSYTLLPYFWLPERPRRRDERIAAIIEEWRRAGLVRTTPGQVVDYDLVLEDLLAIGKTYRLQMVAIDRGFQGAQFCTNLIKHLGAQMVAECPQGILSMNAPFRELLELLKSGRFHHNGDPVARWMASNTVAEERGGLIKPSKDLSSEKIDLITAAVMALREAMISAGPSVYEERGIIVI